MPMPPLSPPAGGTTSPKSPYAAATPTSSPVVALPPSDQIAESRAESLKMNRFCGRLWWWDEGDDRFGFAMVLGVEFFA
jgi:hypothetical protein